MNWFQSTNTKEIGTLYLIFSVFAGILGTACSVLLGLSLLGIQVLQGDHQLFLIVLLLLCGLATYKLLIHGWIVLNVNALLIYTWSPLFKKGKQKTKAKANPNTNKAKLVQQQLAELYNSAVSRTANSCPTPLANNKITLITCLLKTIKFISLVALVFCFFL